MRGGLNCFCFGLSAVFCDMEGSEGVLRVWNFVFWTSCICTSAPTVAFSEYVCSEVLFWGCGVCIEKELLGSSHSFLEVYTK